MPKICVFVLSVLFLFACSVDARPRFWFSTKSSINQTSTEDFHGCYDTECVYVASAPLFDHDRVLGQYDSKNKLWAVAEGKEALEDKKIRFVFSEKRPAELPNSEWITPVTMEHAHYSEFDPTPYLKHLNAPDPLVAKFVDSISLDRIKGRVESLATNFHTRNSYSADAVQAAQYLLNEMTSLGCEKARLENFRSGFSPNVLCEVPGYQSNAPAVFVGAHYDCRSTDVNSPTQRAPGADDNGSGTAGLLDILRTAIELIRTEGYSFRRTLMFGLFAGEEQGLIGSAVYATQLRDDGVALQGMVGLDMIGYPQPNAPTTLYWMSLSTNANLTQLGISLTSVYLGEGTIVTSTRACCSDQQSFNSRGFPAAAVAESLAYTNNPNYHRATDLPETLSFSHVWRTTQSAAALVATLAEPRVN